MPPIVSRRESPVNGLRAAVDASVQAGLTSHERQRHALIDHLIADHGADDRVNGPWPELHRLKIQHGLAHGPETRIGPKSERPNHRHAGPEPWHHPDAWSGAA